MVTAQILLTTGWGRLADRHGGDVGVLARRRDLALDEEWAVVEHFRVDSR